MTKQLNLDEMLEICLTATGPRGNSLKKVGRSAQLTMESVGNMMAQCIAATFDIECGPATFEGVAFAGTCCPFYQKYPGQKTPEALKNYDPDEELRERP